MNSVKYFVDGSTPPTLEEAQKYVDGYVELLDLGDCQILLNENGSYREDLAFNPTATTIVNTSPVKYLIPPCGIRGNVMILCGSARWT